MGAALRWCTRPCARITVLFSHSHIAFISGNVVNHGVASKPMLLIEVDVHSKILLSRNICHVLIRRVDVSGVFLLN